MLSRILTSLGITIGISAALALALSLMGYSFVKMFLLIFVLHFIGFGVIHYFTGVFASIKLRQIQTEQIKLLSFQTAEVMCAACKDPAIVSITLGEDESFECEKCNAKNNIVITAEAVLQTIPVSNLDPDVVIRDKIKLDDHE
jgi:hypothetical protein